MKFLLVALNAKYIHSNLAVHSLKEYCVRQFQKAGVKSPQIEIAEYTINQPLAKILADIYERKADVLFFSCYIWNRQEIEQLVRDLQKIRPDADVWLGGPEVSFDMPEALEAFAKATGIIRGEGEEAFFRLVRAYANRGLGQADEDHDLGKADENHGDGGAETEPDNSAGISGSFLIESADLVEARQRTFLKSADLIKARQQTLLKADHLIEKRRQIPLIAGGFVEAQQQTLSESDRLLKVKPLHLETDSLIAIKTQKPLSMDELPFPYENLADFANRIIYYESSRGCPFRCSYCLSSIEKSLRFKSLDLVKRQLAFFLAHNVKQVKFIDRTFNCNHDHALAIWQYLKEHDNGVTNFHFEIAGELLADSELDLLEKMRPGQIQLEIGVQSTHERTLAEINRPADFSRLSQVVRRLKKPGNIHIHLDLIAGLPFEDLERFKHSFNEVFSLRPHQLQLGFLKVLKGSPLAEHCTAYGLKYSDAPPYEVLETKWISYGQLLQMKAVEEMVEIYYNSGQYTQGLKVLLDAFENPFAFFEKLCAWHQENGLTLLHFSRNQRYEHLLRFGERYIAEQPQRERFQEALIYDYYSRDNEKNRPEFFGAARVEKAFAKAFYSEEARRHRHLNEPQYENITDPRVLRRLTHLEKLGDSYYLFDYTKRNPVTGNVDAVKIT